jgi:hypothetical protein
MLATLNHDGFSFGRITATLSVFVVFLSPSTEMQGWFVIIIASFLMFLSSHNHRLSARTQEGAQKATEYSTRQHNIIMDIIII